MELIVDPAGLLHTLYEETLDLATLGTVTIARASQVEPDRQGQWWADLSPVAGPVLGPFPQRSQALAAERVWLGQHWLEGDRERVKKGGLCAQR